MKMNSYMALALAAVMIIAATGCIKEVVHGGVPFEDAKVETVRVRVIDIAYRSFGDGPPLVMIMGFSGTMDLWSPVVLQALAGKRRVIIFDNRGMGLSTDAPGDYTLLDLADDTAGLMTALGIERADVLGFSMGADVAKGFAVRYPAKVARLVLYAASRGGPDDVPPTPENLKKITDPSGTPQERGRRLISTLFPAQWLKDHPDPRAYFPIPKEHSAAASMKKQEKAMSTPMETDGRLQTIACPVLLITGDEDVLTPPQNSELLAKVIPGAKLVKMAGGHGIMYQDPEAFSRAVLEFLK